MNFRIFFVFVIAIFFSSSVCSTQVINISLQEKGAVLSAPLSHGSSKDIWTNTLDRFALGASHGVMFITE